MTATELEEHAQVRHPPGRSSNMRTRGLDYGMNRNAAGGLKWVGVSLNGLEPARTRQQHTQ